MRVRGLSLIEFMIFVAVLVVMAGLAAPRLEQFERQSRRDQAVEALLAAAECQHRLFTITRRYDAKFCLDRIPVDGKAYDLTIEIPPSGRAFLLSAVPRGRQAEDECGVLRLDEGGKFSMACLAGKVQKVVEI